jgi:serine/threonine-protein kinase
VLPFANLSADPDNEYFSDGITSDIINHLAKVADLQVIARTSVMQYKDTEKRVRQIGRELGVAAVVEGEVQRLDGRVRINAQLIDADTDLHLWADTYDRELTAKDIFEIQSEIAQQIATALRATLTPDERERIEQGPTENVEAYDFYLRGNEYFNRGWDAEDLGIAEQMYQRAVELDPEFALAHTWLSRTHSRIYWFYYDRSDERLLRAREAVDSAFRLEPDLPEAHLALGYYYYHGRLDYENALAQFEVARKSKPNDANTLEAIGYVQRRSGAWEEGVRTLEKVLELSPRSATTAHAVGVTYHWMGDYAEALRFLDRAISLAPDWIVPYFNKAQTWLAWRGDVEGARRVLTNASVALGPAQFFSQVRSVTSARTVFRILHDDYDDALRRLSLASLGGDSGKRPAESLFHAQLGLAYAGLGRADEAIREGREAVELLPVSKEAWYGPDRVEVLAEICVMVGEHDAAIEQLDYLLSVPSRWSIRFIEVDPVWAPLRDDPRFQALLEKYE